MKLLRGLFAIFTVLSLSLCGCCACKKGDKQQKSAKKVRQEISINIVEDPGTLDPRKVRSLTSFNLLQSLMEGLMRIDQTGAPAPAVAKNYSVSSDNLKYTFSLRETSWSNGEPLTAHDFVYAWKKSLSPEFRSDYAFLLFPLKNAKAIKEGLLPTSMLGVKAEDDYTLSLELECITPFFLDLLTSPIYYPVNAKLDRENPNWGNNVNSIICNGPFSILNWTKSDQMQVVKNEMYWDKESVLLDKINMVMVDVDTGFKMYQNGDLHWDGSPYSKIPEDALASVQQTQQVHTAPGLGTYWIRTNTSMFPLHLEEMRKCLALSIDRESIVENVLCGGQMPATGIVPLSMRLREGPYFQDGDIRSAEELLHVALDQEQMKLEDMPPLTLTYYASTSNHRLAQTIQAQWKQNLGLNVQLEPLEKMVYFDRISRTDFQLACGNWIADVRDPINFLELFKTKNVGTNNTNWESMDYLNAINLSYTQSNPVERKETLAVAEKILMDEMPIIPLFHYTMLHVQNENLKDVVLTESGRIDFKWAYLE